MKVIDDLLKILLRATPTFILVLGLYIFLKKVFFNPLERIMQERYEATEGAMKAARAALGAADHKSAEYQQALREARAEIYRARERERQQVLEENARQVRRAREEADDRVRAAREELQADVEAARGWLSQESGALADSIAESVLKAKAEAAP